MSRSFESCLNIAISWIGPILRACVRGRSRKGPACTGGVSSTHISSQYDAIRLTVLNRTEGVVDRTLLRFQDVWGKKQVPNNPNFRSGVIPHLWDDYGKVE